MIKRLIGQTAIWITIVGAISWAVAYLTGQTVPTFISEVNINYGNGITTTLYKFDVAQYLKTLEMNVNIPFKNMFTAFPTMWKPTSWDPTIVIKAFYNIMIWYINVMLWWLNIVVLIPTKLLIQPLIVLLTLLGIDLQRYNIISMVYKMYAQVPKLLNYWN